MNLILLEPGDFPEAGPSGEAGAPAVATLRERRFQHIAEVHRANVGDTLKVGLLDGQIGEGLVVERSDTHITLEVSLHRAPPPPLPLTLILALPRPKMLKRTIQHATALGVKKLYLINAYRVEKSYWQSPWLAEGKLREQCVLGLEQAVDTAMPQIELRKRFKPFVEDELPEIAAGSRKLVAHPVTDTPCPVDIPDQTTLAVGPEGGFIPYEVERLQEAGFESVHLGPRILRVETALPVLLARLFPGR
ncbi:16S rRNA (uracil(1498)-N(3))-methyltransferase [Microbulbifer hydrolyticus]|uniref:Ribosomal RNA small subunit methyltransferase E n=1 Tax=Microbulbifer hydrolyticus TaxID=48074 RepID=A0A6P1T9U9_9GAMM|nr:16S rRNA (uracil(1498)-N(3))-methyltransferase [Microbulbifer hydrolyticus]MBB5213210.1 RsmE family RNA methyltransferase [Microbulbifer hydrolyticus]QHQ38525.1 16S rRNA (uracil(1498)-N(3))-methyltransferase [Microbulbifer hydrolyticus]